MADVEKQPIEADSHDSKQVIEIKHDDSVASSDSLSTPDAQKDATTKPPFNPMGDVPNGGLQAWLQVLGGFSLFFNTWGMLNTFGVYQTYYESGQSFHESSSNISWIGSIQAYCVLLGGIFAGPLYDRGHLRWLLIIGSFGIVFGHMMLSLCHEYWQVLLAQGFCVGLGAGLLFVPGLALLPTYFNARLGMVMGLAASGSSFGGIVYPIAFYKLLGQVGFAWSVRIIGFIALITLLFPIIFLKMRVKPPKARAIIDWTAFTDWPYMTFVLGALIGFMGLYVMLFYVSYFGEATGITNASLSFYLVPILNAASMFGRTMPNALADKTGPINVIAPGAIICGIIIFSMIAVKSAAALIVVTILFGFFSGVFIALPPVCLVSLTQDRSKIGTRIGMAFAMFGFGTLAAGPGGGRILGSYGSSHNWTGLWIFGGVAEIVAGVIFFVLRVWRVGPTLKKKF